MVFSGLKIKITAILFVLMAVALFLCNLILVVFWERSLIRSELAHAESVLDHGVSLRTRMGLDEHGLNKWLSDTCRLLGLPAGIILFQRDAY